MENDGESASACTNTSSKSSSQPSTHLIIYFRPEGTANVPVLSLARDHQPPKLLVDFLLLGHHIIPGRTPRRTSDGCRHRRVFSTAWAAHTPTTHPLRPF